MNSYTDHHGFDELDRRSRLPGVVTVDEAIASLIVSTLFGLSQPPHTPVEAVAANPAPRKAAPGPSALRRFFSRPTTGAGDAVTAR